MPGARTRSVESPWLALGKSFGQPRGMYRTVGDCTAPLAPCNDAVGGKRRILCAPLCETNEDPTDGRGHAQNASAGENVAFRYHDNDDGHAPNWHRAIIGDWPIDYAGYHVPRFCLV